MSVALIIAGIAASVADGSIIANISVIPVAYAPFVLAFLSTALVGLDKFLREKGLEDAAPQVTPAPVTPAVQDAPDVAPPDITNPANGPVNDPANP
jgi:hypothetical protein